MKKVKNVNKKITLVKIYKIKLINCKIKLINMKEKNVKCKNKLKFYKQSFNKSIKRIKNLFKNKDKV